MNKLVKAAALGACRATFPLTEKVFESVLRHRAVETPLCKPIIVIGPERSGTTLVYSLLANHPDLFTLLNIADAFPNHPFSSSVVQRIFSKSNPRYVAVPDTAGQVDGDLLAPREGVRYWMRHLGSKGGGWAKARDDYFSESDLDGRTLEMLPLDLKKRIFITSKTRLLLKQPGFSLKIKYLDALFPDAIFVHCLRNPVSNFASLMAQKNRSGNPDWGVRIPGWEQWRDLPVEVRSARQLAITHQMIQESIGQIKDGEQRYVPVRYEDLHNDFSDEVQRLFGRCEMEAPAAILENAGLFVLSSGKRSAGLDLVQDREARETLEELCDKMGYDASVEGDSSVANGKPQFARAPEPLRKRFYHPITSMISNAWLSNYRAAAKWIFARKEKPSFREPTFRAQWAENWIAILTSWMLLAGVGVLHYYANPHMIFTPFYLVPCAMLTLALNYRWGIVIAGVAAVAGPVLQSFVGGEFGAFSVILWNSLMRFILYVTFVFLLDRVRIEAVSSQTSQA